jgi:hypothetical protein
MKNKSGLILSITFVSLPTIILSLYFILKNLNSTNLLLATVGLVCILGSFMFVFLSFVPKKGKVSTG